MPIANGLIGVLRNYGDTGELRLLQNFDRADDACIRHIEIGTDEEPSFAPRARAIAGQ